MATAGPPATRWILLAGGWYEPAPPGSPLDAATLAHHPPADAPAGGRSLVTSRVPLRMETRSEPRRRGPPIAAPAAPSSFRPPVSSMKGRVLSRGGWPFLMFACGVGVVIIGIRGSERGFGARPGLRWRVAGLGLSGQALCVRAGGSRRRWWRLTRRVESGIGLGGGGRGSGCSGGRAPVR